MSGFAALNHQEENMRAYSGVEGYAFVSYSHRDAEKVVEILEKLSLAGMRIWYDEGIAPSSDYIDVIANKIVGCAFFVAFVSASSLASQYCADEIRFAYEEKKPMMVIRLDDAELPVGMRMILNRYQSHSVSNVEKPDTTAKKLLPSVPEKVKEQNGTLLCTDSSYLYYLQSTEAPHSNQPGYRIIAVSRHVDRQYTIFEKKLPYGSEYDVCYTVHSKRGAGIEVALDVVWDFSFARQMPDDDYFMTRLLYKITTSEPDKQPTVNESVLYRESYTTGERIYYNHVEGQGTIIKKDGTKTVGYVNPSDPLRLKYSDT